MKSIILTCLIVASSAAYAQCPTPDTYVKEKSKSGEKYAVNSQSRSGSVKPGDTYELSFIAQEGMDYRLSTKMLNAEAGSLSYEIYEMVVEKKLVNGKESFKRVKKVLAASGSEGVKPLEFATDKTRKIFVAVTLSGGDGKKAECVGILVEDKKSTKLGF